MFKFVIKYFFLIKIKQNIALHFAALFITMSGFSQIYNTQIEAKIDLKKNTEFIEITGSAYNKTELNQSLRYILSVIKNNSEGSNISKNDQSGRFVLEPGQKKNLSKTTINANDKDRIILLLLVYNFDDKLLGKDRIVLNGTLEDEKEERKINLAKTKSLDATHEKDDGIILRGIVIEDTKTKPGRDFYKMFYSLYTGNNINGNKIVTVEEGFLIANSTVIRVLVGDVLVYRFIVKPQNDYLKDNSYEAIKRVYNHFQILKNEKNTVKHY